MMLLMPGVEISIDTYFLGRVIFTAQLLRKHDHHYCYYSLIVFRMSDNLEDSQYLLLSHLAPWSGSCAMVGRMIFILEESGLFVCLIG